MCPFPVPTEPQALTVANMSSTSIRIDWTPPICDNGIRTGYTVNMISLKYTISHILITDRI